MPTDWMWNQDQEGRRCSPPIGGLEFSKDPILGSIGPLSFPPNAGPCRPGPGTRTMGSTSIRDALRAKGDTILSQMPADLQRPRRSSGCQFSRFERSKFGGAHHPRSWKEPTWNNEGQGPRSVRRAQMEHPIDWESPEQLQKEWTPNLGRLAKPPWQNARETSSASVDHVETNRDQPMERSEVELLDRELVALLV
ncbi:unnamed protein product [Durusdinium trenchii]